MWPFKPNIQRLAMAGNVRRLVRAIERYDDYDIVTEAITALADFPDHQEAVDALIRMACRGHEVFRQDAIGALGRIGGEKVIDRLIKLLDDPEFSIRQETIASLGRCKARQAVPRLLQSLGQNNDERLHAAEALGAIGDRSAVPALQMAAEQEEKAHCRAHFERAIEAIESTPAITDNLRST